MVYDSVTWRLPHEHFVSGAFNAALVEFVDNGRELLHMCPRGLRIKMPGDSPRLLEVPLFEGTDFFIT